MIKSWNGYKVSEETFEELKKLDIKFEDGEIDYNVWQYRTAKLLKEVGTI